MNGAKARFLRGLSEVTSESQESRKYLSRTKTLRRKVHKEQQIDESGKLVDVVVNSIITVTFALEPNPRVVYKMLKRNYKNNMLKKLKNSSVQAIL
tara:strand:- start:5849 stop:6136 length:288 start_codon:yes stop_codon:yes gene_type:complete